MNTLNGTLRWDPVRELEALGRRLTPVFARPFERRDSGELKKPEISVANWAPVVDISEDDSAYHVVAEIPDVKKEDVKVVIENGVLVISGERNRKTEEGDGKTYHRIERITGKFYRSFVMPDDADGASVSAQMQDGVLNVRIGKRAEAKPKIVEIQVG
ncbi:MAG: Hsp20/alpha crystallin family protein [Leptospirillum sp.]